MSIEQKRAYAGHDTIKARNQDQDQGIDPHRYIVTTSEDGGWHISCFRFGDGMGFTNNLENAKRFRWGEAKHIRDMLLGQGANPADVYIQVKESNEPPAAHWYESRD